MSNDLIGEDFSTSHVPHPICKFYNYLITWNFPSNSPRSKCKPANEQRRDPTTTELHTRTNAVRERPHLCTPQLRLYPWRQDENATCVPAIASSFDAQTQTARLLEATSSTNDLCGYRLLVRKRSVVSPRNSCSKCPSSKLSRIRTPLYAVGRTPRCSADYRRWDWSIWAD
jgi:hypothetical protein